MTSYLWSSLLLHASRPFRKKGLALESHCLLYSIDQSHSSLPTIVSLGSNDRNTTRFSLPDIGKGWHGEAGGRDERRIC